MGVNNVGINNVLYSDTSVYKNLLNILYPRSRTPEVVIHVHTNRTSNWISSSLITKLLGNLAQLIANALDGLTNAECA